MDDSLQDTTQLLEQLEDVMTGDDSRPGEDGKVKIIVKDDGVFIQVIPPQEGGTPADWLAAKRALDSKEIVDYDMRSIKDALEEMTGDLVLIAERKPELDRDAEVSVSIEDEGMTAFLEVRPALGGEPLTEDMIRTALTGSGVVEGIKEDVIRDVVSKKKSGRFLIAEGTPPVDGTDATISFKFDTNPDTTPVQLEDGTVDFRNLDLIQNVKAGEVLAERVPPVPGLPGKNVRGQTIKPSGGKSVRLPKGANTVVSEEDENLLLAKESGQAVFKDNKVHVYPVCTINSDVDLETGNIDFVGSVQIHGGVRSGFVVHAAGNVEIRGPVEAATIIADGDVILQKGMQGGDTGQIISGKSVTAKFLEHAKVRAKEDIVVSDAIMYCELEAGKAIKTQGKQGRIVGGIVLAGELIQARTIGSKLGMKTEVEVGVNPEVRRELTELNEEYSQIERQYKMVSNGLARVKRELEAGKNLPAFENARVTKLISTHQQLKDRVKVIEKKRAELEQIVAQSKKGRIVIQDRVYPGVKVSIGKEQMILQDEIQNVAFSLKNNELSQSSAV